MCQTGKSDVTIAFNGFPGMLCGLFTFQETELRHAIKLSDAMTHTHARTQQCIMTKRHLRQEVGQKH